MHAAGIILDAVITVPLFTKPQGVGYMEFFFSLSMLVGFVEYIDLLVYLGDYNSCSGD